MKKMLSQRKKPNIAKHKRDKDISKGSYSYKIVFMLKKWLLNIIIKLVFWIVVGDGIIRKCDVFKGLDTTLLRLLLKTFWLIIFINATEEKINNQLPV